MGLKIVVLAVIVSIVMSGSAAQAIHEDLIHGPCGAKTGYIHMTVAEVDDKVKQRIADGIVDAD
jgi:Skp family chaperone for outer membrane proteins